MKIPRFNQNGRPGAAPRLNAPTYPHRKWIRVPEIADWFRLNTAGSPKKRIFAVVVPSGYAGIGGKMARRILIFDNHPESLRLVFERRLNLHGHIATAGLDKTAARRLTAPRQTRRWRLLVGLIVIFTLLVPATVTSVNSLGVGRNAAVPSFNPAELGRRSNQVVAVARSSASGSLSAGKSPFLVFSPQHGALLQ